MSQETKKSEIIQRLSNLAEMLGKYTAEVVYRRWVEDFVDADTGEVVTINRKEVIMQRGVLLTKDVLSEISFHQQSGDITSILVSNQKREVIFVYNSATVWQVNAQIGKRAVKLLLYATNMDMALEIAKDFIELTYAGTCFLNSAKDIGYYNMLIEHVDIEENAVDNRKFYKIEVKIKEGEESDASEHSQYYIIHATSTATALVEIEKYIAKLQTKSDNKMEEYSVTLETVTLLPITHMIETAFSEVYIKYKQDEND